MLSDAFHAHINPCLHYTSFDILCPFLPLNYICFRFSLLSVPFLSLPFFLQVQNSSCPPLSGLPFIFLMFLECYWSQRTWRLSFYLLLFPPAHRTLFPCLLTLPHLWSFLWRLLPPMISTLNLGQRSWYFCALVLKLYLLLTLYLFFFLNNRIFFCLPFYRLHAHNSTYSHLSVWLWLAAFFHS